MEVGKDTIYSGAQANLNLPVEEVTPEGNRGPLQIVHHNMLRPCASVARDLEVEREVVAEPVPIVTEDKW